MSAPASCPACLRRAWLLQALAPYIERIATSDPGSRVAELLRLDDEPLANAVAPNDAGRILGEVALIGERRMLAEIEAAGCWATCRHDDLYPVSLRAAADAPRSLIAIGEAGLLDGLEASGVVTVVGARRASGYGRQVARELAADVAASGLVVASGMAYGIDGEAHRGALATGRTFAILGCGADIAYPAAHRALHRQIGRSGLILSEMPPGMTPWRWSFPARNRIMAALAQMTVVVEGRIRSGSLITADLAQQLGRDVGAVPGPVTSGASAGPNDLLHGGAFVIRGAQDVLDAMLGIGVKTVSRAGPALEGRLADVLAAVEGGDGTPDSVVSALGLSAGEASIALARLELLGYLDCSLLGVFSRTMQQLPDSPAGAGSRSPGPVS